jgi:hypothetical protein
LFCSRDALIIVASGQRVILIAAWTRPIISVRESYISWQVLDVQFRRHHPRRGVPRKSGALDETDFLFDPEWCVLIMFLDY